KQEEDMGFDEYDLSDGENSAGSGGLNDGDESLYFDEADAQKRRQKERAKVREQKNQAQHGGSLEALLSQAPPPRAKSIGVHGEMTLGGAPRARRTAPLRTKSGGIMKLNRKISRTVTDAARTVVDVTATVADVATSVARGRDENADGQRPTRSNSLGALSRKFSTRVDRGRARQAKQDADGDNSGGGMMNLNLNDNSPKNSPKQGRIRNSSIGALSRRARRGRIKSVDDAEVLLDSDGEMELNLNDHSPPRERNRGGSVGPVSTKARRERWKSVDDAEDLLDAEGDFELSVDASPKTERKPKKEKKGSNSIGAVDTKSRRERKKSVESDDESKAASNRSSKKTKKVKKRTESRSSDTSSDDESREARRKKTKKVKKRSESRSSDTSSDDESREARRKKTKKVKKRSESSSSDTSSDDESREARPKKTKKVKKRTESRSSDTSSDDESRAPIKRKGSTRKKASKSPKPPKIKKASRKLSTEDDESEQETPAMGRLDLGGGQARGAGRRMGRRSSLGAVVEQKQEVNDILARTNRANQRFDASKGENSVIERRMRRRASLGAEEAMMGAAGPRRGVARKKSMDMS
ncbi:MAG: hypothetical protein SGBAC_007359, partial [Bacillariaceae sp.]